MELISSRIRRLAIEYRNTDGKLDITNDIVKHEQNRENLGASKNQGQVFIFVRKLSRNRQKYNCKTEIVRTRGYF